MIGVKKDWSKSSSEMKCWVAIQKLVKDKVFFSRIDKSPIIIFTHGLFYDKS